MKNTLVIGILLVGVTMVNGQKNIQDEFLKMINGSWELTSRVSNGKIANTEGLMIFNLVKRGSKYSGEQLATESGVLDAFVSGSGNNQPYEVASLFTITLDASEKVVNFNAIGEITGDYGPFKKGVPSSQNYAFIFNKGAWYLESQRQTTPSGQPQSSDVNKETQVYDAVILTKDKLVMSSSILKTVDTYKRTNRKNSKIGGLFILSKFYEIFAEKIKSSK